MTANDAPNANMHSLDLGEPTVNPSSDHGCLPSDHGCPYVATQKAVLCHSYATLWQNVYATWKHICGFQDAGPSAANEC